MLSNQCAIDPKSAKDTRDECGWEYFRSLSMLTLERWMPGQLPNARNGPIDFGAIGLASS